MMALAPITATTSGFDPCRIAGRMNSVSTAKLTASATSAISPRSRPTATTTSAKMPASSAIGNFRSTSDTEYCRSRGASGAYATITPCPWCNWRGESGWTISVKVRPLSLPLVTSIFAFLHWVPCAAAPAPACCSAAPAPPPPPSVGGD